MSEPVTFIWNDDGSFCFLIDGRKSTFELLRDGTPRSNYYYNHWKTRYEKEIWPNEATGDCYGLLAGVYLSWLNGLSTTPFLSQ